MICAAPREPPPSRERGGGATLEQPSPCPGRSPRPLADLTARRRPLVVAGGPPPGIGALFASPTRSSRYLLRVHRVTEPYSDNYCKSYEIKNSQFFSGTQVPPRLVQLASALALLLALGAHSAPTLPPAELRWMYSVHASHAIYRSTTLGATWLIRTPEHV